MIVMGTQKRRGINVALAGSSLLDQASKYFKKGKHGGRAECWVPFHDCSEY